VGTGLNIVSRKKILISAGDQATGAMGKALERLLSTIGRGGGRFGNDRANMAFLKNACGRSEGLSKWRPVGVQLPSFHLQPQVSDTRYVTA